jgi:hypothetical protein
VWLEFDRSVPGPFGGGKILQEAPPALASPLVFAVPPFDTGDDAHWVIERLPLLTVVMCQDIERCFELLRRATDTRAVNSVSPPVLFRVRAAQASRRCRRRSTPAERIRVHAVFLAHEVLGHNPLGSRRPDTAKLVHRHGKAEIVGRQARRVGHAMSVTHGVPCVVSLRRGT